MSKISEFPLSLDLGKEFEFLEPKPVVSSSDYNLEDPQVLVELLLTTSKLEFSDETVMYTLDYLVQQEESLVRKVIKALGLVHLQTSEGILIDLLWWLNTGNHPIIQTPEVLECVSRLDPSGPEILELFDKKSRRRLRYGAQILYAIMTGIFIDVSEIFVNLDVENRSPMVDKWS